MTLIWNCELPKKKGQWDNDYLFYDDGTIKHVYDVSVKKYNLEEIVLPSEINSCDKQAIVERLSECPEDWKNFVYNKLQES